MRGMGIAGQVKNATVNNIMILNVYYLIIVIMSWLYARDHWHSRQTVISSDTPSPSSCRTFVLSQAGMVLPAQADNNGVRSCSGKDLYSSLTFLLQFLLGFDSVSLVTT
jgi:hypothetical protein